MKSLFTIALCLFVLIFQHPLPYTDDVSIFGDYSIHSRHFWVEVLFFFILFYSADCKLFLGRGGPFFGSCGPSYRILQRGACWMCDTMSYEWYLQYINHAVNKFIIAALISAALNSILGKFYPFLFFTSNFIFFPSLSLRPKGRHRVANYIYMPLFFAETSNTRYFSVGYM